MMLQKNKHIIVSIPWLFLSGLQVWQAIHKQDSFYYLQAASFFAVAILFFFTQRSSNQSSKPN
jgi:hypothetical protein